MSDEAKRIARHRGWSIRDNDWHEELRSLRIAFSVLVLPTVIAITVKGLTQ